MSFEAIQKVTAVEQAVQQRKADAADEAKRIVAEAERAGRQLVADARARAETQVKELLTQAEVRAQQQAEQEAMANAAACKALKESAQSRVNRAADLIVERVGNG